MAALAVAGLYLKGVAAVGQLREVQKLAEGDGLGIGPGSAECGHAIDQALNLRHASVALGVDGEHAGLGDDAARLQTLAGKGQAQGGAFASWPARALHGDLAAGGDHFSSSAGGTGGEGVQAVAHARERPGGLISGLVRHGCQQGQALAVCQQLDFTCGLRVAHGDGNERIGREHGSFCGLLELHGPAGGRVSHGARQGHGGQAAVGCAELHVKPLVSRLGRKCVAGRCGRAGHALPGCASKVRLLGNAVVGRLRADQAQLNSALAREVAAHGGRRAVQHGRRGQMLAPVHTCADGIALPLRVARGFARA